MESLERLQSVNTTLRLMREHGLCTYGSQEGSTAKFDGTGMVSDRFVADFFIFLAQRCINAQEIKEKCEILVKTLPKVSSTFLQDLVAENRTPGNIHGSQLHILSSPPQAVHEQRLLVTDSAPLIGLRAMERASTTLEDFCRSYFMFHEMDVHNPQQLFKYLPILTFVEAFLYQLDEENEQHIQAQNSGAGAFVFPNTNQDWRADAHALADNDKKDGARSKTCTGDQSYVRNFSSVDGLGTQAFEGLQRALADKGILTERLNSEFRDGLKYWRLEHTLCEAVTNGAQIAAEDVMTAIKLKSFDYRVLNLLLYSLTGREVNEAHFNFLAVSELLVEISDDLYDYEDDVLRNSFNVLRMLVKVYGPTRAPEILAKVISEQEVSYQQRLDKLEPSIAKRYQQRCKEATHEGGGGSTYQFGSWTIPSVIVDEEGFRTQVQPESPT